jgi:hypothetical protein
MAEAAGHTIQFTPPHYSDLQPIETIWAIVKGEVGRQYTTDTKFADVRLRLDAAFANLTSSKIMGCIHKAEENLLKLHKDIKSMDDDSESDSDSDCSKSDSNNDSDMDSSDEEK